MKSHWNIFANTVAQKELPRLSYLNGGYNYRIPLPGAIIEQGKLLANLEFPGIDLRYTTDGSEPNANSKIYDGPVDVSSKIKMKSWSKAYNNTMPHSLTLQRKEGLSFKKQQSSISLSLAWGIYLPPEEKP